MQPQYVSGSNRRLVVVTSSLARSLLNWVYCWRADVAYSLSVDAAVAAAATGATAGYPEECPRDDVFLVAALFAVDFFADVSVQVSAKV